MGRRRRSGFTLIEVVVSTTILAGLTFATMQGVALVARLRMASEDQVRAAYLGRAMMDEIAALPYGGAAVVTPAPAGARTSMDEISDYHAYTERPPRDRTGTVLPGFPEWTRRVRTRFVSTGDFTVVTNTDTGLREVFVQVSSPRGLSWTFRLLRARANDP